ncbi:hypothetical protein Pan54_47320 [Rubinisphaera italica]|uniref:Uncharacterized protein n=1 Tax=Rubinisphaera italica TaxID=2527969 RepID=A0A5C5XQC7_9PLAN|nr:hypothetical protein Pan54_47320 [Rubinisphaera italica]
MLIASVPISGIIWIIQLEYAVLSQGGQTDFVGWVLKAQDALPFALHVYLNCEFIIHGMAQTHSSGPYWFLSRWMFSKSESVCWFPLVAPRPN